jgi:hypothetical protein
VCGVRTLYAAPSPHHEYAALCRRRRVCVCVCVCVCVAGEHSLFCLKESGGAPALRMQKRLEYHPSAYTVYTRPGSAADGARAVCARVCVT